jgi:hypothetical protein
MRACSCHSRVGRSDGRTVGRILLCIILSVGPTVPRSVGQSPRAANPERPTVATHAYAVAPGYWELEQGVRAFGVGTLSESQAWDLNLKLGVRDHVQLGLFATGIGWTHGTAGVGDLGLSVKLQGGLGKEGALAVVPAVTLPTGNETLGLGAGRVLGSLVGVWSQDLGAVFHTDINVGPTGIGAGTPQLFGSLGLAASRGRWAVAGELFHFTAGGAGPLQQGLLGALLWTAAEWAVVDVGGVWGRTDETPDQLFVGVTTNLGRIFK